MRVPRNRSAWKRTWLLPWPLIAPAQRCVAQHGFFRFWNETGASHVYRDPRTTTTHLDLRPPSTFSIAHLVHLCTLSFSSGRQAESLSSLKSKQPSGRNRKSKLK